MSLGDRADVGDDDGIENGNDDSGETMDSTGGHPGWGGREKGGWGGWMLRREVDGVPVCKHLLACLLAERWNVARGVVEERSVGEGEMAGWAAGWGG